MTPEQFQALKPSDVVVSKYSGIVYVVTATFGSRVTAVATVDMTNPPEWELLERGNLGETRLVDEKEPQNATLGN